MKNVLFLLALMFSFSNAFAQINSNWTTAKILSPIESATSLLQQTVGITVSPFISTIMIIASEQGRGIAGKEQLKDELVALNDDMVSGRVKSIEEVRQPALKELLVEISADEAQMESINSVIKEGSHLHRIATAVTVALLAE
jgi:hypothetical protein